MSWQQAPAGVATYPSATPVLNTTTSTFLPVSGLAPLTVRVNPASGIVYFTGSFVAQIGAGAAPPVDIVTAANPLPAQFRPKTAQRVLMFGDNGTGYGAVPVQVNTDGTVHITGQYYGNQTYTINSTYFLDV